MKRLHSWFTDFKLVAKTSTEMFDTLKQLDDHSIGFILVNLTAMWSHAVAPVEADREKLLNEFMTKVRKAIHEIH
jgi:hypothetical protein